MRCGDLGVVTSVRATRHDDPAQTLHPAAGPSPGWLLAEVRVRCAGAPAWQRFPAWRWLQPAEHVGHAPIGCGSELVAVRWLPVLGHKICFGCMQDIDISTESVSAH